MNTDDDILLIDEHHLDRECVKLPSQYRQAAFSAAEKERDLSEAKSELKVKEAQLSMHMRQSPAEFHLDKVTEGALKELLLINPIIQKREKAIRALEYELDLLKKLCTAIDMKKRSLTNLVELHSSGYHAEVRPSKEGREALNKISRDRISRPIPRDRKERERED